MCHYQYTRAKISAVRDAVRVAASFVAVNAVAAPFSLSCPSLPIDGTANVNYIFSKYELLKSNQIQNSLKTETERLHFKAIDQISTPSSLIKVHLFLFKLIDHLIN